MAAVKVFISYRRDSDLLRAMLVDAVVRNHFRHADRPEVEVYRDTRQRVWPGRTPTSHWVATSGSSGGVSATFSGAAIVGAGTDTARTLEYGCSRHHAAGSAAGPDLVDLR
jgi:hypothetical protein